MKFVEQRGGRRGQRRRPHLPLRHKAAEDATPFQQVLHLLTIVRRSVEGRLTQLAFADPKRVIAIDHTHSDDREQRFFCFGKTERGVLTVRFTVRGENIRIFGAGLWREGKQVYEKENKIS